MRLVRAWPPNIDLIRATFQLEGTKPIFAFGDIVYNPYGVPFGPELQVHEAVHGRRQLKIGSDVWWDRYCADADFRLDEELPAHKAEYWRLCRGASLAGKRDVLEYVAKRLAAPIYNWKGTVTEADALRLLSS